jgi:hypothetical protein
MRLIYVSILTALLCSCSNSHIDKAGGSYAYSPDGKWLAEIYDGHSKIHDLPYSTIELWNLKLYPSLKDDISSAKGKAPTIHFEFPQNFFARDEICKVTWEKNSKEFFITFKGGAGSSSNNNLKLRRFKYNLVSDSYSLLPEDQSVSKNSVK